MQGGYVPRQEIVQMLGTASVELFNHYLGNASGLRNGKQAPAVAYQVSTRVDRALNPFLRERIYNPELNVALLNISANGTIAAPTDMVYPTALLAGEADAPVDVLDDMQRVYGLNDPIAGPTADFPKAIVRPGNGYRIYPKPSTVTLTYLALPPVPTYVETYDEETGEATYDNGASVDVGWGRQHEPELLERTLRLLAQATRDGQLSQTADRLTQENS